MNLRQRESTAKYLYDISKGPERCLMDPFLQTYLFLIVIGLLGFGLTVYFDRRRKKKP